MSSDQGKASQSKFPQERESRRVGWTEGPEIRLAGGELWHLPRLDDALIPVLPALRAEAEAFCVDFVAFVYQGEERAAGFERRFLLLVEALLRVQYRNRTRTLGTLIVEADDQSMIELFDVIDGYVHELLAFAARRVPQIPPMTGLASWN